VCDAADFKALADRLPGVVLIDEPPRMAGVTLPTDDWPYVFFRAKRLPLPYLVLLGLLVAIAILPLRLAYQDLFRVHWGFFFLGAAFLLLETSAVVRVALVAGTTWVVNSVVFAGVLVFILLANWIASTGKVQKPDVLFALLGLSLMLSYAFPFSSLLGLPNGAAISIAALVLTVPILFAGIIFSMYFRTAPVPSRALGSNVFGAVLGGLAEYLSMLTGNRSMALLALGLYAAAWVALRGARTG
jgi:hypothetical protein